MRYTLHVAAAASVALVSSTTAQTQVPAGFEALFNEQDLAGWWGVATEDPRGYQALPPAELAARHEASQADIHAHWSVDGSELVNDGHGLFLTTLEDFEDFELRLEYRTVAGADSGIYLRGVPQVQIWDTTEAGGKWGIGADKGSGGLWNNTKGTPGRDPLVHADSPFGAWNAVRIVMVGERVTVELNGRLVVDHARLENYFDRSIPIPRRGPIQLQTHGGEIRWRNVFIRRIGHDEANAILTARGPQGFSPIFNGVDFEGWTGDTDGYEVVGGAMRCRAGHGGNVFTAAEYDDFMLQLQFQLPAGGNNGIVLRYPGKGDGAYAGMCELQVLDNTAEQYANLDPRQYHGSAYGHAAAHRGYLRAPGSWNHQLVHVEGSRITVELNGTRILETDLAAIDERMYDASRFQGMNRRSGHIGFAGHGHAVAFRGISIR